MTKSKKSQFDGRQKLKRILVGIVAGILLAPASSFASGAQYWQSFNVEGKIYKKLSLQISEELRFSQNMSELYYSQADVGFSYEVTEWFSAGALYSQVFESRGYDVDENFHTWRQERRPTPKWTFKLKTKYVTFADINQVEFRFVDGSKFNARYRNKFVVSVPFSFGEFSIAPNLANEIFIDINEGVFNINRFFAGAKAKYTEMFSLELFYLLQSSKKVGYWSDFSALGCKVGVNF